MDMWKVLLVAALLVGGCAGHGFQPVTTACWEFKDRADVSTRNYRLVGLCYDAPGASAAMGGSLVPVGQK